MIRPALIFLIVATSLQCCHNKGIDDFDRDKKAAKKARTVRYTGDTVIRNDKGGSFERNLGSLMGLPAMVGSKAKLNVRIWVADQDMQYVMDITAGEYPKCKVVQ